MSAPDDVEAIAAFRPTPLDGSVSWRALWDALLAGVCHEINGRAFALSSILQVAQLRGDPSFLEQELERECARLTRATGLLNALPSMRREAAGPMSVKTLLDEAVALLGCHVTLRALAIELDVPGSTPAIRSEAYPSAQLLMVALAEAARRALRAGSDAASVTVASAGGDVRLHFHAHGLGVRPDPPGPGHPLDPLFGRDAEAVLAEHLSACGARFETGTGDEFIIAFRAAG